MDVSITPLDNMGARVTGLDLSAEIPPEIQAALREAWWEYEILVFPRSGDLDDARQLRLSHVFGEDEPHTVPELIVPEQPNLIYVQYDGDKTTQMHYVNGKRRLGWVLWHQDEAYTTNIPIGSLLRMVKAADDGGETAYLHIARAYDDLPESLKRRLEGLKVLHTLGAIDADPEAFGMNGLDVRNALADEVRQGEKYLPLKDPSRFPIIESPLVARHPYTGRKTLLLSPLGLMGVAGLDKREGDALLHELCRGLIQEKYQYVHRWSDDDMVLWDNWNTMHMAHGFAPGEKRFGLRTTIKGPTAERTGRVAPNEIAA